MGGIGRSIGNALRGITKTLKKVVSSIEKTLRNPLSLPERFFKNAIIKPTKQIAKEYVRFHARFTRDVFSALSRYTGLKFFDKIGDGAYLFSMAMKKGDWKAIGAAVAVVLSIVATIYSGGSASGTMSASLSYFYSVVNISATAISFGMSLHTLGSMYQHLLSLRALEMEYNAIGIDTIADNSKWLAGGELRNGAFAGGILFFGSGMIDPNAKAFRYGQPDLDATFLTRLRMPYEDKAGGQIYNSALAGVDDWKPRNFLDKYYTPKDPVQQLYEDLGLVSKF